MPTAIARPTEHLNIVIVGHVDHGKSTLLGRLYADTDSLPEGKLDKVRDICRRQGKEFEYAFLFDAFLEEQEQGDRKSTRLNSSHLVISYAVFCLKKKKQHYWI